MISKILASVKSKILFLVSIVLLLAFSFFISYLMNKVISFEDTKYFGDFFMWVKVVVSGLFLLSAIYVVLSSKDVSSKYYFLLSTAIIQIVPLFIRLIGLISKESLAIEMSILALFICGLPYFIFVFYLVIATDKMKIARRETKASVKKAVDEDSYLDENGNFVGVKSKEEK